MTGLEGLLARGRRTGLAALADLRHQGLGRYAGVLVGLAAVCIYLAVTEPVFLTWGNWANIIRSFAVVAILAVGMTFVVLAGGFDLSIASLATAAAMILGLAIDGGWAWWSAAIVCVAVAVGLGFFNGFLIGVGRIPFFVVTLGTLAIYQSFAFLVNDGELISLFEFGSFEPLKDLANGSVGPIPTLLFLVVGLYVVGAVVLRSTSFGRAVYAVGSNREAARLTGIRVTLVVVAVFTISGLFGGIGAIVQTGRLTASSPQADPNLMLTVVAAVLIGGTAFTGGEGGLFGTFVGVLFLGVVQNGLSLSGVSAFWQGMVSGWILIAAVGIGVLREHRLRLPRIRPPARRMQPAESSY